MPIVRVDYFLLKLVQEDKITAFGVSEVAVPKRAVCVGVETEYAVSLLEVRS